MQQRAADEARANQESELEYIDPGEVQVGASKVAIVLEEIRATLESKNLILIPNGPAKSAAQEVAIATTPPLEIVVPSSETVAAPVDVAPGTQDTHSPFEELLAADCVATPSELTLASELPQPETAKPDVMVRIPELVVLLEEEVHSVVEPSYVQSERPMLFVDGCIHTVELEAAAPHQENARQFSELLQEYLDCFEFTEPYREIEAHVVFEYTLELAEELSILELAEPVDQAAIEAQREALHEVVRRLLECMGQDTSEENVALVAMLLTENAWYAAELPQDTADLDPLHERKVFPDHNLQTLLGDAQHTLQQTLGGYAVTFSFV